jgi:hypothetical protein
MEYEKRKSGDFQERISLKESSLITPVSMLEGALSAAKQTEAEIDDEYNPIYNLL